MGQSADALRHSWLLVFLGGLGIGLTIGRIRGAALVNARRVTRQELDGFLVRVFLVFGDAFLLMGLLQALSAEPDVFCLAAFPPRHIQGTALWLGQIVLSGSLVWWIWARKGAHLLARVAPAFTRGPVLERRYSPKMVGLIITGVAILGPLGNILIQLHQPMLRTGFAAV